MAGTRQYHIDAVQGYGGGGLLPREWREIHVVRPQPHTEFYIIIYDSATDSRVLSDIRDQYETLTGQSFDPIIGVRDVYPLAPADAPLIRADFSRFTPQAPVVPELILAIVEIEAWFIGEHTHFRRMHAGLVPPVVQTRLGYDPSTVDVSTIMAPCPELRGVYNVVGIGYDKAKQHVERTVCALSFDEVYLTLGPRVPDLDRLLQLIDGFFDRL